MLHALFAGVSILSPPTPHTHTPPPIRIRLPSPLPLFLSHHPPSHPLPSRLVPGCGALSAAAPLGAHCTASKRRTHRSQTQAHPPSYPGAHRQLPPHSCHVLVRTGVDGGEEGRYKTDSSTYALSLSLGKRCWTLNCLSPSSISFHA
ncbi:hypothetical protein C0Q70_00149 [Pomacea canaliculata]|uniref:Uncharacterized protein n=1 Tax=Pomacea canaliculata TaxID=400727 RepID=A0A2T7PVW3_POMCA|nr:hypothetical protein C0Q70_00149 [Pomacea canaliculata]